MTHSSLTVVESERVTELCVAASCEPVMQARKLDMFGSDKYFM